MNVFERFVLEGKVGLWEFWEGTLRDFLKRECLWYDGTRSNICEKANGEDHVEHGLIRDIKSKMPNSIDCDIRLLQVMTSLCSSKSPFQESQIDWKFKEKNSLRRNHFC